MTNYRKINNLIGWLIFIVALIVYILTLEPTVSWWDPGEYILTAYKLEIGHPPGSPTYGLLGRFFSLFAFGDTSNVAFAINMLSAVASALVSMFLFWIITMLTRKVATRYDSELSKSQIIAIFGSGIVGSLAFAVSESFWFSAVEAESYAVSYLCTTVVFWTALKWEREKDFSKGLRWLIFISLIVGLAIGIHTLNLLALPAVCYVVYFKRYKFSVKGFIAAGITSIVLVAAILFILVPYIVKISSALEIFFVNDLGLPFNSGTIVWFVILFAAIIYLIIWTHKHKKVVLNAIMLSITFVIIGYSTFFVIVIRANADPPINENDPEDAIALLSYLNREQYGTWPLFKGPYYNAVPTGKINGSKVYTKDRKTGKYVVVDQKFEYTYPPEFTTIFPRMFSNQRKSHIELYKSYGKVIGKPVSVTDPYTGESKVEYVPTFGENLRFFFSYQLGHMYFRYFLWNFAGRQNNIESQGEVNHGNWKSGIGFIDTPRIGPQSDLPPSMQNPGNTAFYFLPLILGLYGLYYHSKTQKNDAWIVFVLFFMTGIAIIIYLNQYPQQPRERDYAYPGSFMAFCMWIGIGVYGLYDWLGKTMREHKKTAVAFAVSIVCFLAVPTIMASSGWEPHNRHGKWSAHDWAVNYLESCAPNAILFTNGDNDTFPLWYAQEIEGVRTDVRVVNYVLAGGAWYCHQMMRKAYESDKLPLTLGYDDYKKGTNDQTFVIKRKDGRRVELEDLIRFVGSTKEGTYHEVEGKKYNFLPTNKVKLTINKNAALKSGTVPASKASEIVSDFEWDIKTENILKNDLLLLDLISTNNWERPIYFASPSSVYNVLNLNKYMHQEGMAYRLRPYPAVDVVDGIGGVDPNISYNLLVNKFRWGFLNKDNVVVDRESERNTFFAKEAYRHTASALISVQKNDSAVMVIDKCLEFFPNKKFSYDRYMIPFVQMYYDAGATEKANNLLMDIATRYEQDLDYYARLNGKVAQEYDYDRQIALAVIQNLYQLAKEKNQTEIYEKVNQIFQNHLTLYMPQAEN
ncbi:MAG: protein O-mannosyl-transferase family [Bacteroidales bacterium]